MLEPTCAAQTTGRARRHTLVVRSGDSRQPATAVWHLVTAQRPGRHHNHTINHVISHTWAKSSFYEKVSLTPLTEPKFGHSKFEHANDNCYQVKWSTYSIRLNLEHSTILQRSPRQSSFCRIHLFGSCDWTAPHSCRAWECPTIPDTAGENHDIPTN